MYLSAISLVLLGPQPGNAYIPGIRSTALDSLNGYRSSLLKVSPSTILDFLYTENPKLLDSVPLQYQVVGNNLVNHIFKSPPSLQWKGYQSAKTITNVKNQKFIVGTIFAKFSVRKANIIVFVNGLGLTFVVESVGVPVDANPSDRQLRLTAIVKEFTTFNQDTEKYRLTNAEKFPGMRFGEVQNLSLHTVNFSDSDDSAKLAHTKWWSLVTCLTATDYCVFQASYYGWHEAVISTNFMDAFFKFPNSTLSPISSTYWTKSKE